MPGPRPDLNDLFFFAQVVEHAGFAPAARALGVPKSKLSRRIALLEQRLGVRLIQRSTRRFSVTDIGQEYYQRCVAMLVEADAAQELIDRMHSEPHGTVHLSCQIALLHARVSAMLTKFMAECPHVDVHLEATNRCVDVIGEGFDVALRVRFPPVEDSNLAMKPLGGSPQRLVASPRLLDGAPRIAEPADLARLPSLDLGPPHRKHAWQLKDGAGTSVTVVHQPRFVTDDMTALHAAALQGIGIVQLPDMIVGRDLAEGRLRELLPSWSAAPGVILAIFPSRRGLIPAVRRLLDFLAAEFRSIDGPPGGRLEVPPVLAVS